MESVGQHAPLADPPSSTLGNAAEHAGKTSRELLAGAAERRAQAGVARHATGKRAKKSATPEVTFMDLGPDVYSKMFEAIEGGEGKRTLPGVIQAARWAPVSKSMFKILKSTPSWKQEYTGEYVGDTSIEGGDPDSQSQLILEHKIGELKPCLTAILKLGREQDLLPPEVHEPTYHAEIKATVNLDIAKAAALFFKPPSWELAAELSICEFPDDYPNESWGAVFKAKSWAEVVKPKTLCAAPGDYWQNDFTVTATLTKIKHRNGELVSAEDREKHTHHCDLTQSLAGIRAVTPKLRIACSTESKGVGKAAPSWVIPEVEIDLHGVFGMWQSTLNVYHGAELLRVPAPRQYRPVQIMMDILGAHYKDPCLSWRFGKEVRELGGFQAHNVKWINRQLDPNRSKHIKIGSRWVVLEVSSEKERERERERENRILPAGTKRGAAIRAVRFISASAAELAAPETKEVSSESFLPAYPTRNKAPKESKAPSRAVFATVNASMPRNEGRKSKRREKEDDENFAVDDDEDDDEDDDYVARAAPQDDDEPRTHPNGNVTRLNGRSICRLNGCMNPMQGRSGGGIHDIHIGGFCTPSHRAKYFADRCMPVPLRKNWKERDWLSVPSVASASSSATSKAPEKPEKPKQLEDHGIKDLDIDRNLKDKLALMLQDHKQLMSKRAAQVDSEAEDEEEDKEEDEEEDEEDEAEDEDEEDEAEDEDEDDEDEEDEAEDEEDEAEDEDEDEEQMRAQAQECMKQDYYNSVNMSMEELREYLDARSYRKRGSAARD